ncbi:hypothetical protein RCL1_005119 [Eukaryota sp. TZLM3-RCL]
MTVPSPPLNDSLLSNKSPSECTFLTVAFVFWILGIVLIIMFKPLDETFNIPILPNSTRYLDQIDYAKDLTIESRTELAAPITLYHCPTTPSLSEKPTNHLSIRYEFPIRAGDYEFFSFNLNLNSQVTIKYSVEELLEFLIITGRERFRKWQKEVKVPRDYSCMKGAVDCPDFLTFKANSSHFYYYIFQNHRHTSISGDTTFVLKLTTHDLSNCKIVCELNSEINSCKANATSNLYLLGPNHYFDENFVSKIDIILGESTTVIVYYLGILLVGLTSVYLVIYTITSRLSGNTKEDELLDLIG